MAIPQKMESTIVIVVDEAKFTSYTSIKVELQQAELNLSYIPSVIDDTRISFTIPASDAMQLEDDKVLWQVIAKDADGNNVYTSVKIARVDTILGGQW